MRPTKDSQYLSKGVLQRAKPNWNVDIQSVPHQLQIGNIWGWGRLQKVPKKTPKLEFEVCQQLLRRRQWQPTPVLLPGKSQGRRSLVGCSPWGREEWDTTERLPFHFSLSCIGEGNGNPLQCSCLENPRDGGAWWAAVNGVAQSRTWLKRFSSSSSMHKSLLYSRLHLLFQHNHM